MQRENWRRERDSNPRRGDPAAVFKTAALNHSTISPKFSIYYTLLSKMQIILCAFFIFFPIFHPLFSVSRLTNPENALNYKINTRIIDLDPLLRMQVRTCKTNGHTRKVDASAKAFARAGVPHLSAAVRRIPELIRIASTEATRSHYGR